MAVTRSLVFGNLPQDLSAPLFNSRNAQEFARDEVLISPSLDPYAQIAKAKDIISSGRSLAVESGALGAGSSPRH